MMHLLSVAPLWRLRADARLVPRIRCAHPGLRAVARVADIIAPPAVGSTDPLRLDPHDPVGSLATRGIGLRIVAERLIVRGREIYGLWDPTLRRIELFGYDRGRGDRDLVFGLAHEWAHATGSASEVEADDRARRFVEDLSSQTTAACAAILRHLAVSTPPVNLRDTRPAGIPL